MSIDRLHEANGSKVESKTRHVKPILPDFDITTKIMLVGDSSVGKTCLLIKFRDGTFLSGSFISTVGIDFRNKIIEVDDTKVKLQIWDTAGQERFRSITRAYYRDAEAILLVFDVTNNSSFTNVRNWLSDIKEYAKAGTIVMLVGNKVDMVNERVVKHADAQRIAEEAGIPYMETSAKSGQNVELAFTALAKTLKEMKLPNESQEKGSSNVKLQKYISPNSADKGCKC